MSEIIVLDAIPFQFDSGELSAKLHLTEDDAEISRAWKNLIGNVTALARPKALFRECSVESAIVGEPPHASVILAQSVAVM